MKPIDFTKMTHIEAVMLLERLQAVLQNMAKLGKAGLAKSEIDNLGAAPIAFRDGSLHSICHCLDVLQGREIGSTLRELMKVPEPCVDPLFV